MLRKPSPSSRTLAPAVVLSAVAFACATAGVRAGETSDGDCKVPTPHVSVAPFVPTAKQRNDMLVTLHSTAAFDMREQFDATAAGKATTPQTERALAAAAPNLLRDRFVIMNDEKGATASERIFTVLFKHHLTTLYQIWTYDLGSGGPWEVRGFAPLQCSADQMRFVQSRYGSYVASLPGA